MCVCVHECTSERISYNCISEILSNTWLLQRVKIKWNRWASINFNFPNNLSDCIWHVTYTTCLYRYSTPFLALCRSISFIRCILSDMDASICEFWTWNIHRHPLDTHTTLNISFKHRIRSKWYAFTPTNPRSVRCCTVHNERSGKTPYFIHFMHCCQSCERLNYLFRIQILNRSLTLHLLYPGQIVPNKRTGMRYMISCSTYTNMNCNQPIPTNEQFSTHTQPFPLCSTAEKPKLNGSYKIHSLARFCARATKIDNLQLKLQDEPSGGSFKLSINWLVRKR